MFNFKREHLKKIDYWLVLCIFALVGIGMLAISSATSYSGDIDILRSQFLFFIAGLGLMVLAMSIDYHLLGEWYLPIYILMNIVLIAVFFLGKNVNGATRWIQVGPMTIQPSEFAKIGCILCTAKMLEKYNDKINSIPSLLIIGLFHFVPFILVNRQPNLSTSLVILGILVIQLFISKLDFKVMLTTVGIGTLVLGIALAYIIGNPNQKLLPDYQRNRIVTKIQGGDNLAENYPTNQSVHAIGSGGLEGKGLYQGAISQLNYLPESHNDFIVAIIAEEFGFIGILIVLGIILFMIARGLWIAHAAPDNFGRFIIAGYMGMIAMQTFVNMGVVTSLLPNTGLPLPFISYGGSSLWANMIGIGLVLNVGMRKEKSMF